MMARSEGTCLGMLKRRNTELKKPLACSRGFFTKEIQ